MTLVRIWIMSRFLERDASALVVVDAQQGPAMWLMYA